MDMLPIGLLALALLVIGSGLLRLARRGGEPIPGGGKSSTSPTRQLNSPGMLRRRCGDAVGGGPCRGAHGNVKRLVPWWRAERVFEPPARLELSTPIYIKKKNLKFIRPYLTHECSPINIIADWELDEAKICSHPGPRGCRGFQIDRDSNACEGALRDTAKEALRATMAILNGPAVVASAAPTTGSSARPSWDREVESA